MASSQQAREEQRDAWIAELVNNVLHSAGAAGPRLVELCGAPTASAFIYVHLARYHTAGRTAHEMSARLHSWRPDERWPSTVLASLSAFRARGLPGPLAQHLDVTWISLFLIAREAQQSPDITDTYLEPKSEVSRLLGSWRAWKRRPLPDVSIGTITSDALLPGTVTRMATRHLHPYRDLQVGMFRNVPEADAFPTTGDLAALLELETALLPLERLYLLPDPVELATADAVLEVGLHTIDQWNTSIGGWADRLPPDDTPIVPSWLADLVVSGGARSVKTTTGVLHSWIIVSGGGADLAPIRRLLRAAERMAIERTERGLTLWMIAPAFAGDPSPVSTRFYYDCQSAEATRHLLTIGLTGHIRLEVLAITDGQLRFEGATGVEIPKEGQDILMSTALEAYRARWGKPDAFFQGLTAEHLIDQSEPRFLFSENARYETLWELSPLRPSLVLKGELRQVVESTRRRMLTTLGDQARAQLRGVTFDPSIQQMAREEFEVALSAARTGAWRPPASVSHVLPAGTGFLHVDLRVTRSTSRSVVRV